MGVTHLSSFWAENAPIEMAKILRSALASSTTGTTTIETFSNINTKRPIEATTHTGNNSGPKETNNFDPISSSILLPLQGINNIGYNSGNSKNDENNVTSNAMHSFTTSASTTAIIGSNNFDPFFASPASDIYNKTTQAQLLEAERARIRAEFFATYDVMTGVRIAATLGGFFGLMVFLIVWKSRSSSNETMKVLKDPKMAAVAAVCMQEEEEREIQEAMVATGMSIYPDEYDAILYRRQRMLSLGNVSAPPMLNRGFRFSSVGGGGYSNLLEPPRRFSLSSTSGALSIGGGSYPSSRRRSVSETSRIFNNYPTGSTFGTDDFFVETDDELENGTLDHIEHATPVNYLVDNGPERTSPTKSKQGFLQVPITGPDSRRSSAMTCCSTDSSYLERRYSAYTLGMRNLPPTLQRKPSTVSRTSSTDNWDYYYPDIQVTEATPKSSPYPSEGNIYEKVLSSQAQTQTIKTTIQESTLKPHDMKALTMTTCGQDTSSKNKALTTQSTGTSIATSIQMGPLSFNNLTRKHSVAYYDIESAQSGRKQQIHSISADTIDMYPYNQPLSERGIYESTSQNETPPLTTSNIHQSQLKTDSSSQDLQLSNVGCKIGAVEVLGAVAVHNVDNNNTFTLSHKPTTNSSSISIDSSPLSIDKLNGSGSVGTISARALFTVNRRAPLASLSSFKISSLEYQDSEMRSLDDDSAFLESVADTDEDMQQLSSDSEEISLNNNHNHELSQQQILVPNSINESNSSLEVKALSHRRSMNPAKENTMTTNATNVCTTNVMNSEFLTASARTRRALFRRHRTISVSSSDRVTLLGRQLTEFPNNGTQTSTSSVESRAPIESRFGNVSTTLHGHGQLIQQFSDPYSQPTTTTTADEETGSIDNVELIEGTRYVGATQQLSTTQDSYRAPDITTTSSNETARASIEGRTSATLTQYSSLTTVVSFDRISPLLGSQLDIGRSENSMTTGDAHQSSRTNEEQQHIQQQPEKLPLSLVTDDHCASSISDSHTTRHHQLITDRPSSIYPGTTTPPAFSRSATNLSNIKIKNIKHPDHQSTHATVLELPLINLPTGDNTSNSSDNSLPAEYNIKIKHTKSKHDNTSAQYTSLPGSSHKLSRETLF